MCRKTLHINKNGQGVRGWSYSCLFQENGKGRVSKNWSSNGDLVRIIQGICTIMYNSLLCHGVMGTVVFPLARSYGSWVAVKGCERHVANRPTQGRFLESNARSLVVGLKHLSIEWIVVWTIIQSLHGHGESFSPPQTDDLKRNDLNDLKGFRYDLQF